MRVSNEEKQRSRARILAAASRAFREHGLEGASLSDIMRDAGMTHGGFYKHFADKDALVEAALTEAFDGFVAPLAQAEDPGALAAFRARYLSRAHRDTPGRGCPIAALASETARGVSTARAAMTAGTDAMIEQFSRRGTGAADARRTAIRDLAALVGAIVIARAVDDPLAEEVLAALRVSPE